MNRRFVASLLAAASFFMSSQAEAKINTKIDLGPSYMHIDFLRNGKTINRLDLYGMQGNASFILSDLEGRASFLNGLTIKTSALYGRNDGVTSSVGGGIGWTIPVTVLKNKIYLTPNVGYSVGYLRAQSDLDSSFPAPLAGTRAKQGYHNKTKSIGIDISMKVTEKLSTTSMIQYAWTRSRVTFDSPIIELLRAMNPELSNTGENESKGFNLGSLFDYWLTDNVSISVAIGLQRSNSKEKNAMRAYGGRLGMGFFF